MKTIATMNGDVLDLTQFVFKDADELLAFLYKRCKSYQTFAPYAIPDIVVLTESQRALLPEGDFIRSPFNIMEIQVRKE